MSLEIRPRQKADFPDLAQVLVRVHARDGYPVEGVTEPEMWLTPPHELAAWTALYDGLPVGQVSLTLAVDGDDAATLWRGVTGKSIGELAIPARLFVDPEKRRCGAGKKLMHAAYEFASERGLSVAFDVMLKDQAAISLYEALGCRRLGTVTHHHGEAQSERAAVYEAPPWSSSR
ncbi:GNAT family N-acetyltransferase [Crossiella sp. CA198]|uniref:GNAT family N-acetyltransferase n=1 Tax=Crossiella sp. CA198 TaxID=3455607 RepID=UPI003F8CF2F2